MAEFAMQQEIDVDADTLWDVVRRLDYVKLVDWLVTSCEVTGHEVGDERTIGLADGVSVRQRLESRDDERRCLTLRTIDTEGFAASDVLTAIDVQASGPDKSTMSWNATFETDEDAEVWKSVYRDFVLATVKGLRDHFARQTER